MNNIIRTMKDISKRVVAPCLALVVAVLSLAMMAREKIPHAPYAPATDYGWRPSAWKLTPEAAALVREWNAKPYVPKSGRTDFIIRAQLKYGLNRDNYIHGWYDRPLLQDSSFGQRIDSPTEKKPWLNEQSWRKTVEMGRLGKQAAFGVFTNTSSRDEVIPLSQKPGSEMTILVELTKGMKMEDCLKRAKQALDMPNSYRLGGKVVLTSYPQIGEEDLPFYAKLKAELTERYGDRFLLMPYCTLVGKERPEGAFDVADLEKIRAWMERALRALDGFCQASRDPYANRRYDPWLFDNVMAPVVRKVFSEPEFKDKYLAWWATPGHENSYRWNYGLDCTGTRMLRDTLANIVSLRPDFFVGAEWDEENENTCFRPMVAHGFTHQRLMRYFHDLANNGGKYDVFPGDDTTVPNLVVSYRKELMAGEPLEVEVLNIPDGTFDGEDVTVGFAWKKPNGDVVRAFAPQRLRGSELAAAWFKEDVSKLVADPSLVPELTVWAKGEKRVFSSGLWPVGLHATRCLEYKWTKQPLRDLPKDVVGGIAIAETDSNGVMTVCGKVSSPRRLRSIAVLDGPDTVYMYDGSREKDARSVRVRIATQGYRICGNNHWLKGRIAVVGAPGAKLRLGVTRGGVTVGKDAFVLKGAPLNNKLMTLFAEIPLEEIDGCLFQADVPGFFTGEVPLKDLLAKEVVAMPGPKGSDLVFSAFLSQVDIPDPQMVPVAEFSFKFRSAWPNSVLRLELVDEDYRVWRGRPIALGEKTGRMVTYGVYERDADRVSAVTVDAWRLDGTSYSFEPSRGAVVAGNGGRGLWGVLGGADTIVTGFGYGDAVLGHVVAKNSKFDAKVPHWEKSAPDWVREPDGSWALQFGGASYVMLPQQVWPTYASFVLEMSLCPREVDAREGLLTTGGTSSSMWIEHGRVFARFYLRNRYVREGDKSAAVVVEGPEIAAGSWQTLRLVCDQRQAYLEVDGRRGAAVPVSGDLFYPMHTALGVSDLNDFYTGKMKSFKVETGRFGDMLNARIEAVSEAGGGRVTVPPGRHVSGTIVLRSNVELHLEDGAEILGSDRMEDFPLFRSPVTRTQKDVRGWTALVYAEGATNIAVTGRGTIDGRGMLQTARTEPANEHDLNGRARNILFVSCRGVTVRDVFLKNPGMWNQHYFDCEDVRIAGVRVFARCNHNNDGLDIDSCRRVTVRNCTIDSADDAIVLKSTSPKPCEDICVEDCVLSSQATAFKCGTESMGGFRRVRVRNLKIGPSAVRTDYTHPLFLTNGISAVEIATVDGGMIEDVHVGDIEATGVANPFYIRVGNRARAIRPGERGLPPGAMRNVTISNFRGYDLGNLCASVTAFEPGRMSGVRLRNIRCEVRGGCSDADWTNDFLDVADAYPSPMRTKNVAAYGLFVRFAGDLDILDCETVLKDGDTRHVCVMDDGTGSARKARWKGCHGLAK